MAKSRLQEDKSMKKTVSVLLVLTMLLALTSTAVASCKFKENDRIEFVRNTVAYKNHRDGSKTGTVVRKGSVSVVKSTCGDKWVELYLDFFDEANTAWFKVDNLKKTDRYVEQPEEDRQVCRSPRRQHGLEILRLYLLFQRRRG